MISFLWSVEKICDEMVHLMPHKDGHYNSIPKVDVLLVLLYCLIYILNKVLIFSLKKKKKKKENIFSLFNVSGRPE